MKIVLASHNPGKISELQTLLANFAITVVPQDTLGIEEIAETELTFVENAIAKARHACQYSGLPALADDSGLVVRALQGAPGIYSARYAGKNATAKDNIQHLLTQMKDFTEDQRDAYFYCVLVFLMDAKDPTPLICQGSWQGKILFTPQGENGFGYDPIFFDPLQNCSAAQLSLALKNKISHRGQALALLLTKLAEKLNASIISQKS